MLFHSSIIIFIVVVFIFVIVVAGICVQEEA